MLVRLVNSLLWAAFAGLLAVLLGFIALFIYVRYFVPHQPGVGGAFGGILPLFLLAGTTFCTVFLLRISRRDRKQKLVP